MYYPDLTPYSYCFRALQTGRCFSDVLNVGWLALPNEYTKGDVPEQFLPKLFVLLTRLLTRQTRGCHHCQYCPGPPDPPEETEEWTVVKLPGGGTMAFPRQKAALRDGKGAWLGSAQIWVPSVEGDVIYAAPTLIYHYVEAHRYCPPREFIDAVLAFRVESSFDAKAESGRRYRALAEEL